MDNKLLDITFIGSGISTSFSLLNLLNLVEKNPNRRKIHIAVIEKFSEFNTGIPYGKRSGFSTLLITSLKNFLPEPEQSLFINWLNDNKVWLIEEMRSEGDCLTEKWIVDHTEAIENGNWEELFIPRRFFGCYVNEKIKNKVENLKHKADVYFLQGTAIDLVKKNDFYNISLKSGEYVVSKKVVLSVGSLPTRKLYKDQNIIKREGLMLVNTPYTPSINKNLKKMNSFLRERPENETTNVLIIGANASALEMLYKLNDNAENKSRPIHYVFLSTLGRAPDAYIDNERKEAFKPVHLLSLQNEKELTAKIIAKAAFKDIELSDSIQLGASSTVEKISAAFGKLLNKLSEDELVNFACNYGNQIGQKQRCAGVHYSDTIKWLKSLNRFEHIAGRFTDLIKVKNKPEYQLRFLNTHTREQEIHNKNFHLVINCIGSKTLSSKKLSPLIKNVIEKKYCVPNASKIGFKVNKNLETIKNLHIMGPLLAGNVINDAPVWHVEHCGRIIWISKILSKILLNDLSDHCNMLCDTKKYKLEINNLTDLPSIDRYINLLREKWNNNIYYSFDHLKYFQKDTDLLKYFLFKINGEEKVLMPIILRKIPSSKMKKVYFDAIAPYGYSGPLYDNNISEYDRLKFWKAVDNWYLQNNVISEFIRFSLNGNHTNYSGLLINSLKNIKGLLKTDFEKQWEMFLPKVRNNYRKATSYNLKFKLYHGDEINKEIVQVFSNIYTGTMERLGAKSIYFFSLKYFENLILNNLNNFSIAFTYFEQTPISTELVIKDNKVLYAFLGGTNSNYYNLRPNDYLRVELIKWAIDNNFKYYVLGGGIKDGDGLYKNKKALFPKDDDVIFYTGRKIINQDIYDRLSNDHVEDYHNTRNEHLKKSFFPLYRVKEA